MTTSQAVLAFFAHPEVRSNHFAPELLDSYTPDMEIQINVAPRWRPASARPPQYLDRP